MGPRRRIAIAAAGAGTLGAAVACRALWHEPRQSRVREMALALPRWPAELHGLRVALISDLHAGAPHVDEQRIERLVAGVNPHAPDLVVLLGDFIDPTVRGGRPVAPEAAAQVLFQSLCTLGSPCAAAPEGDPERLLDQHVDLLLRGLLVGADAALPSGSAAVGPP